jgi:hypothetical protein
MGRSFANGPINFDGIWGVINSMPNDCSICNLNNRRKNGTICEGCCMGFNSTYSGDGSKRTRVCPSSIFKQFGLKDVSAMGKHTLFYFLHHPEMNFTFPDLPDEDLLGNISKDKARLLGWSEERIKKEAKTFIWHIHHEKKYFNDRKEYIILCLNTEHRGYFEKRE